jgi:hypothetical protein
MGEVQVLVPSENADHSRSIIDDYYTGKLDTDEDPSATE